MGDQLLPLPLAERSVHLCVDMQQIFSAEGPWPTPWMDRVLPVAAALANRHPERTYDPRHPNDRLLLGMKVTMSEMKLSLFRHRSLEPLKQKARRGELFLTLAIGYLKTSHDRDRKGSRSPRPGGNRACFRQVRRAADGSVDPSLDAPGGAERAPQRARGRQGRRGRRPRCALRRARSVEGGSDAVAGRP